MRHAPVLFLLSIITLLDLRMTCFGVSVYPSMNPSRVQLRRFAILGSLITAIPKYSLIFCIACTRAVDWPTTQMIQTYLAGAAASVAKDGVAPESGQDAPLREEQY